MFCAYTRARYQVNVYRTIGPLFFFIIGGYSFYPLKVCSDVYCILFYCDTMN